MSVLTTLSEQGLDVLDADIRNDYFLLYIFIVEHWMFGDLILVWYFIDRFDTSTRCKS